MPMYVTSFNSYIGSSPFPHLTSGDPLQRILVCYDNENIEPYGSDLNETNPIEPYGPDQNESITIVPFDENINLFNITVNILS